LWIGTGSPFPDDNVEDNKTGILTEGGLNKLGGKTGKFTRFMHDDKDTTTLINDKVGAIFEDKAGNFWIGTAGRRSCI
jgi:ligand-binding sensor domain-containing protein